MSTETLVLVTAVLAAGVALNLTFWLISRRRDSETTGAAGFDGDPFVERPSARPAEELDGSERRGRGAYERTVRVVALGFLAAVLASVAAGDLWPTSAPLIYLIVAAGMFVLLAQDLIPAGLAGRGRYVLEAVSAVIFVTVLVAATGGVSSPFFFGYFLLVIAASLWMQGAAPLALALAAGMAYVVSVVLAPGPAGLGRAELTRVGFNLLALGLLAYVASVVGGEQRRSREAALRLSRFDPLTGLYNRNYFFLMLEREVQRAARIKRRFCLLMVDVDDLKPVNDQFGHHYGDRLLRGVSDVIRGAIRASDLAAKYGGDEFVVILPETEPAGAYILAEKLRAGIGTMALRTETRLVRTSVSIGVSTYPDDGTTGDQLVMAADSAMYRSKQLGKNRVTAPGLTEPPTPAMSMPIVNEQSMVGDPTAEGTLMQSFGARAPAAAPSPVSVMPANVAERAPRGRPQARLQSPSGRQHERPAFPGGEQDAPPPAPPQTSAGGRAPEASAAPRWPSFNAASRRAPTPVFPPRARPPIQSVDVDPWGPVDHSRSPWDAPPSAEQPATPEPAPAPASDPTPGWPPHSYDPRRLPATGTFPSPSESGWRSRRQRRDDDRPTQG